MDRTPVRPSDRILNDLRRRILAGEWETDQALPTVAVFAGEYAVSRATVSRVLWRLEGEGLVRVIPRWGTFRN